MYGSARNAFYVSAVVAFLCVLAYLNRGEFMSHGRNHYHPTLPLPPTSANHETDETLKLAVWRAPPAIQEYQRLGIEDTNESWWENRNSTKTVYIATFTGLANVLQTMASAYTVAYRENINMKVKKHTPIRSKCVLFVPDCILAQPTVSSNLG